MDKYFLLTSVNHIRPLQDKLIPQKTLSNHLAKMPELAKWLNSDLSKGFTVPQVAQKHDWPEPIY